MTQSAVYIPSLDAKDIYLTNHYIQDDPSHYVDGNLKGYTLLTKNGDYNTKRFINTLDYSLDLIKLRDVYRRAYNRINGFEFAVGDKSYTRHVINVTFKYSIKDFNRIGENVYVKIGYDYNLLKDDMYDCVCIKDDELVAIQVDEDVLIPLPPEYLGRAFYYEGGQYHVKSNLKSVHTVADLRTDLYENGFWCDGIHYVRFKRSSGSSRVGKCLFINEALYSRMHKWEKCGLVIKDGQGIDLAGFESYISLTLSSIIGTLEIQPENILLIDDYNSVFKDRVAVTRIGRNKHLKSTAEEVEISNCIWDGQSLIDYSLLGEYDKYGMVLLRNRFFKSCCFNTNIQAFFKNYGITEVSQLNGKTFAKSIEDVKLITTPSSIKYLKFGTFEKWIEHLDPLFGVVKHDKKTHYFDGQLVSSHYQLINTLQLSEEEMEEFMRPSMEYLRMLDTDPAAMRLQVKCPQSDEYSLPTMPIESKNDIVYKLMGLNEEFTKTKIYADFKHDVIKAYKNNLRCGHVLINGNYSTLLGNPMEMLLAAIGKFDGNSIIGIGNVHSTRFEYDKDLLLCRSPHCTMGNLCIEHNVECNLIDIYFNLTDEIICLNSIGENILNRLSGCDFDSDTAIVTDNEILLRAAKKNYDKFLVPTGMVDSKKRKRKYTNAEKADLDIKTSVNKIGEIINLSQELNTRLWNNLNNGEPFDGANELMYNDIAMLDVMSNLEIDSAKKEFSFNRAEELRILCKKYHIEDDNGKQVKPNFFAHISKQKGYYNPEKKNYMKHKTSMDYLQKEVNKFRQEYTSRDYKKFYELFDSERYSMNSVKFPQVKKIINLIRDSRNASKEIWSKDQYDTATKMDLSNSVRQDCINEIGKLKMSYSTIYHLMMLMERDEYKDIRTVMFNTLFAIPNESFFKALRSNMRGVSELWQNKAGNISIYGITYSRVAPQVALFSV